MTIQYYFIAVVTTRRGRKRIDGGVASVDVTLTKEDRNNDTLFSVPFTRRRRRR